MVCYGPGGVIRPAVILWIDPDRQWAPVIEQLQSIMPELLFFGDYQPKKRMRPAIWLRCVIEGTLPGVEMPQETTPVIYLPQISRQVLRAARECPDELKPV